MLPKRALLDVDPTIVERNLMITQNPQADEFEHLFPTAKDEVPSKLVKPTPGFCVKTRSDVGKVFINVCQTDAIPPPDDISESQLLEILQSETPSVFRVPMSIGESRPETDKSGNEATAYDIAINPVFFIKIQNNKLFKQFFLTVVFEGLQDKYRITIDTSVFTILKNTKAMGSLQLHRIQQREINRKMMNKPKKLIEELDGPYTPIEPKKKQMVDTEVGNESGLNLVYDGLREPAYRLVKLKNASDEEYLVGDVYMPDITSIKDVTLDVGEDRIILESRYRGYLLDIFVPYSLQQNSVKAQLNKNAGILTITMPIVQTAY